MSVGGVALSPCCRSWLSVFVALERAETALVSQSGHSIARPDFSCRATNICCLPAPLNTPKLCQVSGEDDKQTSLVPYIPEKGLSRSHTLEKAHEPVGGWKASRPEWLSVTGGLQSGQCVQWHQQPPTSLQPLLAIFRFTGLTVFPVSSDVSLIINTSLLNYTFYGYCELK